MFDIPGTETTTPADMDFVWHANWRAIGFGGPWWLLPEFPFEEDPVPLLDEVFGVNCLLAGWALMLFCETTKAVEAGEARET